MKTLKQKWEEVNPVLLGILLTIFIIALIIFGISKLIPDPFQENQKDIKNIKLCQDNGLGVYYTDFGYRCKPIN